MIEHVTHRTPRMSWFLQVFLLNQLWFVSTISFPFVLLQWPHIRMPLCLFFFRLVTRGNITRYISPKFCQFKEFWPLWYVWKQRMFFRCFGPSLGLTMNSMKPHTGGIYSWISLKRVDAWEAWSELHSKWDGFLLPLFLLYQIFLLYYSTFFFFKFVFESLRGGHYQERVHMLAGHKSTTWSENVGPGEFPDSVNLALVQVLYLVCFEKLLPAFFFTFTCVPEAEKEIRDKVHEKFFPH